MTAIDEVTAARGPQDPTPWRDGRVPVLLLGLMFLPTAIQAAFFPRSFFDDFPLGRGWVSGDASPYNEHLVRDVGGLFLALVIVSLLAWLRPGLCGPVAGAWLVQGVLHVTFHAGHLPEFGSADKVGLVGSLAVVPALAIWGIVSARNVARVGP